MFTTTRLLTFTCLAVTLLMSIFFCCLASEDFCWKRSYSRARAGMRLASCSPKQELEDGVCYTKCMPDHKRNGPICSHVCPRGFTQIDHDRCLKPATYERGRGFARKPGEILYGKALRRCQSRNRGVKCYRSGTRMYPECRDGYKKRGGLCAAVCPPGFESIKQWCTPPLYDSGPSTVPTTCDSAHQYSGRLCYEDCVVHYIGSGPMCRVACPSGLVDCKAGCASSFETCVNATKHHVVSVLQALGRVLDVQSSKDIVKTAAEDAFETLTYNLTVAEFMMQVRQVAAGVGQTLEDKAIEAIENVLTPDKFFNKMDINPTVLAMIVLSFPRTFCDYDMNYFYQ